MKNRQHVTGFIWVVTEKPQDSDDVPVYAILLFSLFVPREHTLLHIVLRLIVRLRTQVAFAFGVLQGLALCVCVQG